MSQTQSLLIDVYRELNAKKLFWISLALSALVAASLFMVGINDQGIKLLAWQLDNSFLNTQTTTPEAFYKLLFASLGVRYWLGLAATALAVISTAGFFPDMLKPGSIDLLLAKPIGRLRLFLTRYVFGLLFAFLQVLVFTTLSFLAIGIRGGVWEPGLFLAVPLFTLFFSYLFAISALVGVMTRSTTTTLLVTLLLWALLMGVNFTDMILSGLQYESEVKAEQLEDRLTFAEHLDPKRLEEFEYSYMPLDLLREQTQEARASAENWAQIMDVVKLVKTPLPKTGETLDMLHRLTIEAADLPTGAALDDGSSDESPSGIRSEEQIAREQAEGLNRPAWWVIGTSLIFEVILVGLAAWRFCRRDY